MPVNNIHNSSPTFWTKSLADELFGFLVTRLKCAELAAELTQDTYLGLRKFIEKTPPDNLRALSFRIAKNLLIDHQRKTQTRQAYHDDDLFDTVVDAVSGPTPTPEQELISQELVSTVKSALDELPALCRTVFVLHSTEELTTVEIAKRLDISKYHVNQMLTKAILHCAQRLEH